MKQANLLFTTFMILTLSYQALSLEGKGTENNPYKISNAEDFDKMREVQDKEIKQIFVVTRDIDLKGKKFKPLYLFKDSVFDGQNKTISNLKVNNVKYIEGENNSSGFFSSSYGGIIKNVVLKNISVEGTEYVGGLVGTNTGQIQNSSVLEGEVKGDEFVGGLVGISTGEITSSLASVRVEGTYTIGGLVGVNFKKIKKSYASGNVSGKKEVGGLVGQGADKSELQNSYASGNINGNSDVGGLIGWHAGTVFLKNSYASGNVSGKEKVGSLVGTQAGYTKVIDSYASGNVKINEIEQEKAVLIGKKDAATEVKNSSYIIESEIGNKLFQQITASWDQSIWQFDKNNHPKLKK